MFEVICSDIYGQTVTHLTQWDIDQSLIIENSGLNEAPEFHFCNQKSEEALVVASSIENGVISVKVPNSLLREPYVIFAYMYVYSTTTSAKVLATIQLPIRPRVKPSEYKYVENIDVVSAAKIAQEVQEQFAAQNEKLDTEFAAQNEKLDTEFAAQNATITIKFRELDTKYDESVVKFLSAFNGSPNGFFTNEDDLLEKDPGIYINKNDGFIHYWDGETLSEGIIQYQAVDIANNTIIKDMLSDDLQYNVMINQKLSFDTVNLFDANSSLNKPGFYIGEHGYVDGTDLVDDKNRYLYGVTHPIFVDKGNRLRLTHSTAQGEVYRAARVDYDGNFIEALETNKQNMGEITLEYFIPDVSGWYVFNYDPRYANDPNSNYAMMVCRNIDYPPIIDGKVNFIPYSETLNAKIKGENIVGDIPAVALGADKYVLNLGDSIFGEYHDDRAVSYKLAQKLGCPVINSGFGETRLTPTDSGYSQYFSGSNVVNAIVSGNWNALVTEAPNQGVNYYSDTVETLKAVDFSMVTDVTLNYGANDWDDNAPLDGNTYGCYKYALREVIGMLQAYYPNVRIHVVSVINRFFEDGTDGRTKTNANGDTLEDFYNAACQVCHETMVDFVDVFYGSGFNHTTRNYYFDDNLIYPNTYGNDVLVDIIAGALLYGGINNIPSKTSELDNDSGFLTEAPVISVNGMTGAVKIDTENVVTVIVTANEDGSFSADKTCQELTDSHHAGKMLRCWYYDEDLYLPLVSRHGIFTFSAVCDAKEYTVSIFDSSSGDTEITCSIKALSDSDGGNVDNELVVQVTDSEATFIADKTFEDIVSAYRAGHDVRCTFMVMVLPLVRVAQDKCTFTCVYNAQIYSINIGIDNSVVISNEEIGDNGGTVKTVNGISPDESGNVALSDYPILLPTGTWRGNTDYTTVTEIRFVESYNPESYDETWDAGEVAGSITAYREGDILTVSANGKRKIKLNTNVAGMFSSCRKLKTILGLEMLDASAVTHLGGIFVNCYELTSVDMSAWHCGKVTSMGGMFQYCYDLQSVKMHHGLNSETVTVTASVFEDCFKLREVDMANGPISVGDRMFAKCINLEHVSGLSAVTTIGTKAFIYCPNLKSIDLNPAILTSIGESAFRLSSVEDCINMDELNTDCVIADYATRSRRWSDNAVLAAIQNKPIPTILLNVPHADSQKRYTDVKFGHRNVPWDDTEDAVDVYIAEGGCSALSLYHEWQCIHHGTELEKDNFLHYWEAFEGDNFVNNNTEEKMADYFPVQAEMLGWGHSEEFITTADQYDVIIDRLNKHMPTCTIMRTAGNSGHHAVVIVGADALSRKLAVLDSSVTSESAVLTWVKFEDIFSGSDYNDGDYDRLVVHTYGDSFKGYEPPEYIPAPEAAAVGQTIVVKSVDENGKPTEWEAADFPSGGSQWRLINTVTTTEDALAKVTCTTDSEGQPFSLTEVYVKTLLPVSTTAIGTNFIYLNGAYFNGPAAGAKIGYGSLYANGILDQVSTANGEYAQWYLQGNRPIPNAPYITKVELAGQSGGKNIPLGTTLEIWGR